MSGFTCRGVELVSECEISVRTDPFLIDHVFGGQIIVPGVMAFEAMAQAARAVTGDTRTPSFEAVVFNRPMVVSEKDALVLRVAALVNEDGSVGAVVRAADSDFRVDCVSATMRFDTAQGWPDIGHVSGHASGDASGDASGKPIAADQVYGSLLFHEGRFRRIDEYRELSPHSCTAVVTRPPQRDWFARHLPGRLLLGDPAINDAAIHAYQPCIPHRPLLPQSVKRIRWREAGALPHTIRAREVARDDRGVTVDVTIADATGQVWQAWDGLRLNTVAGAHYHGPWNPTFLGNFIVHGVEGLMVRNTPEANGGDGAGGRRGRHGLRVTVENGALRQDPQGREQAIVRLAGDVRPQRRPDGYPELDDGRFLSLSYDHALTCLAVAETRVGCDIETVEGRDGARWSDLLGKERFALAELLARELGHSLSEAATMVWCCQEAVRKTDTGVSPALHWSTHQADGWILLQAGALAVATTVVHLNNREEPLGIAIAINEEAGHAHRQ